MNPAHKVTILGCGSSGGVPRIGNIWGACDPNEPRNQRRRCSILVEKGDDPAARTSVLIDTSPDMRDQLNGANAGRLDAVIYTHDHADQAHGIDDLRMVAMNMRQRVDVYADEQTFDTLMTRFGYCFSSPEGSYYPAILSGHLIEAPYVPISIEGPGGVIEFLPYMQEHGAINCLGYRFGNIAYSADIVGLPERSFEALEGLDVWIVDALRYEPHPSHAHVDLTLEWIARLKPKLAVLTNLHIDLDYRTLERELPQGVVPAYDGMVVEA